VAFGQSIVVRSAGVERAAVLRHARRIGHHLTDQAVQSCNDRIDVAHAAGPSAGVDAEQHALPAGARRGTLER